MDVRNKVALITGGASGLGAQTARYLHAQGVRIVLLDRTFEHVPTLAAELGSLNFVGNVTDEVAVSKIITQVVAQWGGVHIVVNCAGVATAGRIVSRTGVALPLADFEQVIAINLTGTFNVMRLVAAQMMQQPVVNEDGERGVIINTASVAAFEGQIGQAAYSASKGGIVALTLPAARELAQFGIRVMTIAPGVMATPMIANMPEKVQQSLAASMPFPARLGQPNEYAQLVGHIIENSYLNGSIIRLDAAIRMASQ